jgi:hypothetical protein
MHGLAYGAMLVVSAKFYRIGQATDVFPFPHSNRIEADNSRRRHFLLIFFKCGKIKAGILGVSP